MSDTFAENAAAERERLYALDARGHFWRGTRLQPWTARRELLFATLAEALDQDPRYAQLNKLDHLTVIEARMKELLGAHSPEEINPSTIITWTFFQPHTACVLYLASHTPEQWDTLSASLPAWINHIMAWADTHILPDELEPAVRLAHALRTAHQQLVTLPRPDATTSRRIDSGNSPCPSN